MKLPILKMWFTSRAPLEEGQSIEAGSLRFHFMIRRRLYELNYRVPLDAPQAVVSAVRPDAHCPGCGRRGHRRHGAHFDHEWRCGDCELVWVPGDAHLMIEMVESVKPPKTRGSATRREKPPIETLNL